MKKKKKKKNKKKKKKKTVSVQIKHTNNSIIALRIIGRYITRPAHYDLKDRKRAGHLDNISCKLCLWLTLMIYLSNIFRKLLRLIIIDYAY